MNSSPCRSKKKKEFESIITKTPPHGDFSSSLIRVEGWPLQRNCSGETNSIWEALNVKKAVS